MTLRILVACALLVYAVAAVDAQRGRGAGAAPAAPQGRGQGSPASQRPPQTATPQQYPPEQVEAGRTRFGAQCGFCHGRDAAGGESGPDLTRSALVAADVRGDRIGPVVRSGRNGMPPFTLSEPDLAAIVAYIHDQKTQADSAVGGRRSVDVSDLQTGNAPAGQKYFDAACTKCHSATGDLAGVATRLQGLALLQRMLYPSGPPRDPKRAPQVTVTLADGQRVTGRLAYRDEFTIALTDAAGWYRSWATRQIRFTVDDPLQAHVEQLGKYTDADMHDVLAYLQTLR
ncbi:MAG TPA: c-type cytochrome [Vicinamibacterales bacterium]|jgi:cytochrome c oxidase cbb3-type subunit 3|nr:c-type cytochrome [Vicinamibacterales bacterium]